MGSNRSSACLQKESFKEVKLRFDHNPIRGLRQPSPTFPDQGRQSASPDSPHPSTTG